MSYYSIYWNNKVIEKLLSQQKVDSNQASTTNNRNLYYVRT